MNNPKCKRCGCEINHNPYRPLDGNGPVCHIGSDTYYYDCYLELKDKYEDHDDYRETNEYYDEDHEDDYEYDESFY